jgi:hypothetical protein
VVGAVGRLLVDVELEFELAVEFDDVVLFPSLVEFPLGVGARVEVKMKVLVDAICFPSVPVLNATNNEVIVVTVFDDEFFWFDWNRIS